MGQFSVLSKKQSPKTTLASNHAIYKDLYGINKVLSLLNERAPPHFYFQIYNTNNQLAKFYKNLSVGSTSVEWP